MKAILIWFVCFNFLYAAPLLIDEGFVSHMSGPYQTNYEDPEKRLTVQKIFEPSGLTPYLKNTSSYTNSVFWSSFDITNTSDIPQTIVLRNLRAGTDYIDVHLFHNGVYTNKILLGDMRPQNERTMLSIKSVFYLTLKPHETIKVITRFDSLGAYDLEWEVSSTKRYSHINGLELIFFGMFGGILLALIIYNMTMYFNLKKSVFLVYVFHAALLLWFQYAYNGMIYFLNIQVDLLTITLSTWYIPYFMIAFLGIFTILFFDFHRTHRFVTYFLSLLILINGVIGFVFVYAYWNLDLLLYTNYAFLVTLITLISYFFVGIYAIYKRYAGGWYYVIGEGGYMFSLLYLSIVLAGKTPTGYFTYIVPASVIIEILMFTIALGTWVKILRIDNDKSQKLIMDEARFVAIGKNVGMAVHLWKEPLSQLGSHLLYIKARQHLDNPFSPDIQEHIDGIENLVSHMKHTINDIYDSCTDVTFVSTFPICNTIEIALRFQKDRLTLSNVSVSIECSPELSILGSKNALINVLMTLIDNSIAQFQSARTPNPKITITVQEQERYIAIVFEDNGGGITISPISNIFDIDVSTKGSHGSGMGLALAKMMVEKRLNGTIITSNTLNGARFEITIPLEENRQ